MVLLFPLNEKGITLVGCVLAKILLDLVARYFSSQSCYEWEVLGDHRGKSFDVTEESFCDRQVALRFSSAY